ncbi:MAG: murein biosynthesis integral membrane protein MurJ [Desulfuromonadales bacterium]|uniref:murein biosynthesis integral membrane protein MurJ n=1 Tax=Desulfuromonas sp. KJ2020 TaxID=2919173 RepID=UPI0020A79144|nr:murein biosynthesis integral membrane protein MurJ [Desulfuromonas sp. KJ2020]MCP3177658.1 murein biosynthesis integral membrane protein MurJ [Desulfuromonas sp. KJ2020]
MSEKRHISRATGIMGLATGLSRIGGLVRDMVVAGFFGAGFATDAFFMAFTIPNLLRRFFAEGSLTAAFVPTFSDVLHREGPEEARRVASICWTLLLLVLTLVTLAGVLGSPYIVRFIGFGFGSIEGKLALTDYLNRIMFPYIFFVSLLALLTGILNVHGRYFWPSVSPLVLNIAMVLSAIFLSPLFEVPITALAVGVLLGGLLQLLMQFPALKATEIRLRLDFSFSHPAVRRIASLMLPGIAGVAIYQINVVLTRLLASFLPEGSVSYLYYGQRLFEFPQGIFIVSLAQAVLPSMSRQASLGDMDGLKESLRFALILIALFTLPAAVGLLLCAVPVFSLFFMSGAFGFEEVRQSALALAFYAPGLFFLGISRVVVPAFYAMKNTRTPVWISFWTLLVNAGLGLALMGPFKHLGLALALTLSSVFNGALLLWMLRRVAGPLGLMPVITNLLRLIPVTLLMGIVVWSILQFGPWTEAGRHGLKAAVLFAAVSTGMLVYGVGCMVVRIPQAAEAYALIRRKLGRRV